MAQKSTPKKTAAKRILVAEDEQALARALTLKLEHEGFSVTTVHDGQSVLNEVGQGKFDLLLLDLIMPGMDGWAVLSQLREQKVIMPIIVTSNLSQSSDVEKAKALGVAQYLVKSDVSLAEVIKAVVTTLSNI